MITYLEPIRSYVVSTPAGDLVGIQEGVCYICIALERERHQITVSVSPLPQPDQLIIVDDKGQLFIPMLQCGWRAPNTITINQPGQRVLGPALWYYLAYDAAAANSPV